MVALTLVAVFALAACWTAGEVLDKPILRRVSAPIFTVLVAAVVYGAAVIGTSLDDSILYSGATKDFVSALVAAIDRGDADAAHAELRTFESVSIETYEGGNLLRWLREPIERLSDDDGVVDSGE